MRLAMAPLLLALVPLALMPSAAFAAGDAAAAHQDFSRCAACHSTQAGHNGIGPSLWSVVGRSSGSEAGYHYSPAMMHAHLTWDTATLDRFLANPQGAVHGTKMYVGVPDATQRQDIIAYLQTLK